jgi:NDP-sugar pyrophosphorylase family protein
LHRREPVYAYAFPGGWFDVGDREQLLAADNRMRERAGLPARDAYVLDV